MMRIITFCIALFVVFGFASCSNESSKFEALEKSYQDSIVDLKKQLAEAKSLIETLRYPADQRLQKAQSYFDKGELDEAEREINDLKKLFPNSQETTSSLALKQKISQKRDEIKKEEERVKALGFKAIQQLSVLKIDYNTITLSNITTGSRFVFDAYDDSWYYRDADRGSKYVTMQMSVTSTSHEPQLPQAALYSINGDEMDFVSTFDTKFARWRDYGAYLGNYHDSTNDFSKVSTVKFKLGCQVNEGVLSKPYAIVLMNKNVLHYRYERFDNPPVSYVGSADYPQKLTLDNFQSDYTLVKTVNL